MLFFLSAGRAVESDEQLIERANGGDVEAFGALYRRYRDWVCGLARRFTGDRELALDVLQETFAYLLKKFPGFKLTCRMTSFLYPAVKNLSIAAVRKRRRYISPEDGVENTYIPDPPAGEARTQLAEALKGLNAEQREVVLMRFVDDMTMEEMAEALGIPSGTAKSRLYKALAILREDGRTRDYFLG
jgi:RNA polymerase sigma-70 factor (ECF subfamily)